MGMGFGDSLRAARAGKGGKVLSQYLLWCPDDLQGLRGDDQIATLNCFDKLKFMDMRMY